MRSNRRYSLTSSAPNDDPTINAIRASSANAATAGSVVPNERMPSPGRALLTNRMA